MDRKTEGEKCPFCKPGNDLEIWDLWQLTDGSCNGYTVICKNCDCQGPLGRTKEEALELWNNRV